MIQNNVVNTAMNIVLIVTACIFLYSMETVRDLLIQCSNKIEHLCFYMNTMMSVNMCILQEIKIPG